MLTPKQLKGIAKTGGFDSHSDELYEIASAMLSMSANRQPYTEVDGCEYVENDDGRNFQDPACIAEEWRRQMDKD